MALRQYLDRSTLIFLTITALSCTTRLITTAIVIRLATISTATSRLRLAVAASVFEILALVTLIAAVALFLRRASRSLMMIAWFPGALCCLIGTLISLISMGLTLKSVRDIAKPSTQGHARDLAVAGIAFAGLGLFPQFTLFVLIWPRMNQSCSSVREHQSSCPSPALSEKRSIAVHLAALSPAHLFKSSEPCPSDHGECSRYAARSGIQPMSSKTRLLLGASFASRDSRSIHSGAESAAMSEPVRSNSEFENWDTSAVEAYSQSKGTILEPIPGSRPSSPANPLDGPFIAKETRPEDTPLPESPLRSPASEGGASLRNFRRPSENEELYYHPLFRSESPARPLASPGTVITASPFAGQIVSPELVAPRILHSAASSRPASPSILPPVRSNAGSIRSCRTLSPASPLERVGALPPWESGQRGPSNLSN